MPPADQQAHGSSSDPDLMSSASAEAGALPVCPSPANTSEPDDGDGDFPTEMHIYQDQRCVHTLLCFGHKHSSTNIAALHCRADAID